VTSLVFWRLRNEFPRVVRAQRDGKSIARRGNASLQAILAVKLAIPAVQRRKVHEAAV
jgi:hypothetical protein